MHASTELGTHTHTHTHTNTNLEDLGLCSPDPPTAFTQYMAVKRNGGTHNSPNCARAFTRVRREGFAVRNCLELPATWHSSRQCNNSKTQVNLTTEKLMRPNTFFCFVLFVRLLQQTKLNENNPPLPQAKNRQNRLFKMHSKCT